MNGSYSIATAIGFIAILLWGGLAILSKQAGDFPPFQLLALCFSIAFIFMLLTQVSEFISLAQMNSSRYSRPSCRRVKLSICMTCVKKLTTV